jgi:hypothetical protein
MVRFAREGHDVRESQHNVLISAALPQRELVPRTRHTTRTGSVPRSSTHSPMVVPLLQVDDVITQL